MDLTELPEIWRIALGTVNLSDADVGDQMDDDDDDAATPQVEAAGYPDSWGHSRDIVEPAGGEAMQSSHQ